MTPEGDGNPENGGGEARSPVSFAAAALLLPLSSLQFCVTGVALLFVFVSANTVQTTLPQAAASSYFFRRSSSTSGTEV